MKINKRKPILAEGMDNHLNESTFIEDCWAMIDALKLRMSIEDDQRLIDVQQSLLDSLLICVGRAEQIQETEPKAEEPEPVPEEVEPEEPVEEPKEEEKPEPEAEPEPKPEPEPDITIIMDGTSDEDDCAEDAFSCDFSEPDRMSVGFSDKDIEKLQGIPSED